MRPAHRIHLRLIKDELEQTIIPSTGNAYARLMAEVASGLLARMLIEDEVVPVARDEALRAYRALLPELGNILDATAIRPLQHALDNPTATMDGDFEALLRGLVTTLLVRGSAGAELARRLVAIDCRRREAAETAFEAELSSAGTAQAPTPETLDEEQCRNLLAWLQRQFPEERTLRIVGVERLAGGQSKLTQLLRFDGNVALPSALVMRRDREFDVAKGSVSAEFPLIGKLHELGVAVPRPFALEATGDVLGTRFILVAHLRGHTIGNFIQVTDTNPDVALDYARALARVHRVPLAPVADLVKRGNEPTQQRVLGEIEEHERDWTALRRSCFVMDCAYDWLKQHIHLADGQRSLVHRDVGAHNMLVDAGRVTALLDWERCTTGNPAEDLGCIHYMIKQMTDWDTFMACYEEAAGFHVPKEQIDFYTLWGSVRLATMIARANVPILEGKLKHLQLAYSGEHFVQRLLQRVSGKLAGVLGGN